MKLRRLVRAGQAMTSIGVRVRARLRSCRQPGLSTPALAARCLQALVIACSIAFIAIFVAADTSAQQLTAAEAARAKSISLKVKCMCGGCNDPAGACYHSGGTFSGPCDMALSEIKLVDQKVAKGESDDQILKDFVAQYGPTVLVAPPKKGFDLTAWVVPVLVPLIALVLVWEIARRWRQKDPTIPATAPASQVTAEIIARVQRDIDRDES